jgi:hypothetical protein
MSKVYYIENLTWKNELEQIYFIEDEFGVCYAFSSTKEENEFIFEGTYDSLKDFKSHWQNFDRDAIVARVV